MTDERIEDVIAEMTASHQRNPETDEDEPFYSQSDVDGYAARLTAALERERVVDTQGGGGDGTRGALVNSSSNQGEEMTLAEELRALAERVSDPLITWRKEVSEELLALADRAEALEAAAQPPGLAGNFVRAYERNRELEAKLQRERSPEREAFIEAAEEYASAMRRDARNAHDGEAVQRDIDKKRARFYETHRAMLAAEEKRGDK